MHQRVFCELGTFRSQTTGGLPASSCDGDGSALDCPGACCLFRPGKLGMCMLPKGFRGLHLLVFGTLPGAPSTGASPLTGGRAAAAACSAAACRARLRPGRGELL